MRLAPESVTLGVLAGGRSSRLGGRDKAWLQIDGRAQVLRIVERFTSRCGTVLVSANRDPERYENQGWVAVADRHRDLGPIGGLEALAASCGTPWLFTVPVDALDCDEAVLDALTSAGGDGAVLRDGDGLQPLAALYRVAALRPGITTAIAAGHYSVCGLQDALGLESVELPAMRLGNLNTPDDLRRAGCTED